MEKAYVGIDVNLSGYGLAILDRREVKLEWIPFIQKRKIDEAMHEWIEATKKLENIIDVKYPQSDLIIAIEDPTAMEKGAWQTAAVLNKLIGMLSMSLYDIHAMYHDYTVKLIYPSAVIWKKVIIGTAGSKKKKVTKKDVMAVTSKRLLGIEKVDYFVDNHHVSDAVALAMYAEKYDMGELE